LRVAGLVVGHDFHFGRGGAADAAFLRATGERLGFGVEVIDPVAAGAERVSSSGIRAALAARDLAGAARLLGRPYSMRGRVVPGQQLGRTLGFPTANIRVRRRRSPLSGIFAVRVRGIEDGPGARVFGGVASLGTRPTVGGVEPLLEVFVFDFAGDLYGRELEVEFIAHLREEVRFESLETMVVQMHADVAEARERLAEFFQRMIQ
jgi:riboflavin kinase/FMN adenylyltransferase